MKIRELADKLNKIIQDNPDLNAEVMFTMENYDEDGGLVLDYYEVTDVIGAPLGCAVMLEHEFAF